MHVSRKGSAIFEVAMMFFQSSGIKAFLIFLYRSIKVKSLSREKKL
jgi:hypothetical protein